MLVTKQLTIREVSINDIESVHTYSCNQSVGKYMLRLPYNSIDDTKLYVENAISEMSKKKPKYIVFVIERNTKVIGEISIIVDTDKSIGDIGWIMSLGYQNHGYTYEAVSALIPYAFEKFKLSKMIAYCDSRNKASFSLMKKLNMKYISDDRKRTYKSGEIINELLCEIYK